MKRWIPLSMALALLLGAAACRADPQPAPASEADPFVPATEEYSVYADETLGYSLEIPTELGEGSASDGVVTFRSAAGDLICVLTAYPNPGGETPETVMEGIPFQYGDVTLDEPGRMTKIGVGSELDGLMGHAAVSGSLCLSIAYSFEATRMEACQDYFSHALETLQMPQ